MQVPDGIIKATEETTGTVFAPQEASLSARQKWLASGSLISGSVRIDGGAVKALLNRNSLLAVGIQQVSDSFEKGEVFEIMDEENTIIAIARAKESSETVAQNLKSQGFIVANADDIVLL